MGCSGAVTRTGRTLAKCASDATVPVNIFVTCYCFLSYVAEPSVWFWWFMGLERQFKV